MEYDPAYDAAYITDSTVDAQDVEAQLFSSDDTDDKNFKVSYSRKFATRW